jgi:hypothetical protein
MDISLRFIGMCGDSFLDEDDVVSHADEFYWSPRMQLEEKSELTIENRE